MKIRVGFGPKIHAIGLHLILTHIVDFLQWCHWNWIGEQVMIKTLLLQSTINIAGTDFLHVNHAIYPKNLGEIDLTVYESYFFLLPFRLEEFGIFLSPKICVKKWQRRTKYRSMKPKLMTGE